MQIKPIRMALGGLALLLLQAQLDLPVALAADAGEAAAPIPGVASHADGIDWRKGDVDAAFHEAKDANKPLFIYWGASWCPPCNQVKATIFNRQDFIERSHFFVPVYIDGDSPGAQKLGARFKVSGYPTMILLDANGNEILRLPGEVDAEKYLQLLETGMSGGKPIRGTLTAALGKQPNLTEKDWRLLAYYSWETDEQTLVPSAQVGSTLQQLAKNCPADEADNRTRLLLSAAAVEASEKKPTMAVPDKTQALQKLEALLADPVAARQSFDLLTGDAGAMTAYLTPAKSTSRKHLVTAWDTALDKLADDTTLSNTDRLSALSAKISLARLDTPKGPLDAALTQQVVAQAQQLDGATTSPYERQSVVNAAAGNLADAGLLDDSDHMLKAELTRSHQPYYFMLDLAGNAKKRGDNKTALDWYRKAYEASEGPATRLQWGVVYVRALVDLAPDDDKDIDAVSDQLVHDVGGMQNAFYERNLHGLKRLSEVLAKWDMNPKHASAYQHFHDSLKTVCSGLPADDPQRSSCDALLEPAKKNPKYLGHARQRASRSRLA